MIYELPLSARYSLDTGCLINAWKKNYPPDIFAPVWKHVDQLIRPVAKVAWAQGGRNVGEAPRHQKPATRLTMPATMANLAA